MRVKRRFSTRWGHPYHLPGACTECRQTLLHPLCSITPMTPEGYTEYSAQSKREDTSEVAAMIQGVLRHCTEMTIERQYTDSAGQSHVGFALCTLLGF